MRNSFQSKSGSWVNFPRTNFSAKMRLFCFPYSGAGASVFYTWPKIFSPLRTLEVGLIQYPGRETRLSEPGFTRLDAMVESAADGLMDYLDKPFAFFGHSLGALVSFGLANYLRDHIGKMPLHLFISSHPAPQIRYREDPIYDLAEEAFREEICSLSGMQKEVLENSELMQIIIPILRADFEICDTYEYKDHDPLDCPITAFGGLQDKDVPVSHLEAWKEQTIGNFKLRMLPGNHFFLHEERHLLIEMIARELIADLETVQLSEKR